MRETSRVIYVARKPQSRHLYRHSFVNSDGRFEDKNARCWSQSSWSQSELVLTQLFRFCLAASVTVTPFNVRFHLWQSQSCRALPHPGRETAGRERGKTVCVRQVDALRWWSVSSDCWCCCSHVIDVKQQRSVCDLFNERDERFTQRCALPYCPHLRAFRLFVCCPPRFKRDIVNGTGANKPPCVIIEWRR